MPRPFEDEPETRADQTAWRQYLQPEARNGFFRADGDYSVDEAVFATYARNAARRHGVRVKINYSRPHGYVKVTVLGQRETPARQAG